MMSIELSHQVAGLPWPAVLAGGVGAVVGTAAALSGAAARRPDLPTGRWMRPLPGGPARLIDQRVTRVVLRLVGLVAVIVGLPALAALPQPVTGGAVLAWLVAAASVTGPVWRLLNPARAVTRGGWLGHRGGDEAPADVRPAAVALAALGAVLVSTTDPRLVASAFAVHLTVHACLGLLWGGGWYRRGDPLEVLTGLAAHLAPVGRDVDRRLVWRNPVVAAAHASPPRGVLLVTAVTMAIAVSQATTGAAAESWPALLGRAGPVVVLTATLMVTWSALRLAVIREFFRSAALPVMVAYALLAGGRWLAPVDLVVFVALHTFSVVLLHRQALARHDLRTARALQFPPRVLLIASVVVGLTLASVW